MLSDGTWVGSIDGNADDVGACDGFSEGNLLLDGDKVGSCEGIKDVVG